MIRTHQIHAGLLPTDGTRAILRDVYFSPLGRAISFVQNCFGWVTRPFMVYGFRDPNTGTFRRMTRVSSTAVILCRENLRISDNCWIWHHSIIDCSNTVTIGEGVQIGAWVGVFSHSSHIAIRLHGRQYIEVDRSERVGYVRGPVEIGDYTFIGSSSLVMPGVRIGKGCVVGAGSLVNKSVPDYSVVAGNPARLIGKTTAMDAEFLHDPAVREQYYDKSLLDAGSM